MALAAAYRLLAEPAAASRIGLFPRVRRRCDVESKFRMRMLLGDGLECDPLYTGEQCGELYPLLPCVRREGRREERLRAPK